MSKLTPAQARVLARIEAEGIIDQTSGERFRVVQDLYMKGLIEFDVQPSKSQSMHASCTWMAAVK